MKMSFWRAIIRDVPDNEKVAGEAEPQIKSSSKFNCLSTFALRWEYRARAPAKATVRRNESIVSPGGHRVFWKFVTEILESEFEAFGDERRVFDGFRQIGEEVLHLRSGFEVALGVDAEKASGGIESMCDAARK